MLVFIIPAWHPTKKKPNHCRWILPHIDIVKSIANVVVLHVDQEAEQGCSLEVTETNGHFYLFSPIHKNKLTRTKFGYPRILNDYYANLEKLYSKAVVKYGKPDIIHAHVSMPAGHGATELGLKYKIPVIVTEHYSGFFSDTRFPWRLGSFYREMIRSANGFYVVSPGFKNRIEEMRGLKVSGVTPNPINTELFKPTNPRIKDGVLRLVSTGTVGHIKGTDILLAAVAKLPFDLNWQLIIVGNTSAEQSQWKGLQDPRVTLLPSKSQEELAGIYSQSDVYIVSSRVETANVSMLEAMACGCYVISAKIGAPETLLDGNVASFFESGNDPELKNKILDFTCVKRNEQRNYVLQNYSIETVATELESIYEDVLKKS